VSEAHRFSAELEAGRGGGAMLLVPPEIATALGGLKQMRMVGTINGIPYQSSVMPYGGRGLFLGVHKATREAAGVVPGELVDVVVSRDERPRVVEVPAELAAALAANPEAQAAFDQLSFTNRKEMATSVAEAKRPETRERRLAAAMARLRSQ
jgi:hypothetical protein